eukprot:Pgem_evm1s7827
MSNFANSAKESNNNWKILDNNNISKTNFSLISPFLSGGIGLTQVNQASQILN